MDQLEPLLYDLSDWISPHTDNIALAIIATLLVIFGEDINRTVKKQLRPFPYLVRLFGFIILCAFGYGAMTVYATPLMESLIKQIPELYLAPCIALLFILIGLLAERRRQI